MIYVGKMKEINQTQGAIRITVQGQSLTGYDDRVEFLPKSKINIKRDKVTGEFYIYIPDWLLYKKQINWHRISEIVPILPK